MTDDLARARTLLASAARVLVVTGAGISAESGVPTFRGAGGLWKQFRPEDLATPEAFARDPRLVWEWYGWRRSLLAACRPNPGHLALARWMQHRPGVTLVTQNVDALHEAAMRAVAPDAPGAAAPVRLHGSIARNRCSRCSRTGDAWEDETPIDATSLETLPHCPACGALLRPDVVWFGEPLPADAIARAEAACAEADACLVVGTAGAVYPAAGFVLAVARRERPVIVVDPGETAFDQVAAVKLVGTAGAVLPQLME
ncbi:MAG TPA: NAD-dependent protein deacylase [Gemmatimonadales bacterium]|nr:NAD-dependent protein deacylase [Gemmatimonadales bacterium]